MKLIIKAKKIKRNGAILQHIHQRVGFAFARSRQIVESLTITVRDINGPKGGVDKECTVLVRTNALPTIVIKEKQSRIRVAIDRAITRASHNLMQRLKRNRAIQVRGESLRYLSPPEASAC